VTLTIDGSSDGTQEPISHVVCMTPDTKPLLYAVINHKTEKQSSDVLFKDLQVCTNNLKNMGVTVKGVITDNEKKMLKVRSKFGLMGDGVQRATPGDPAHALQLVLKDILTHPDFEVVVSQSSIVSTKFKNTRCKQFLSIQKKYDRLGIPIGNLTRWGSNFASINTLLGLKPEILKVCGLKEAEDYVSQELKDICFNQSFWKQLSDLKELIEPIARRITLLEGDNYISNVLKIWLDLEKEYDVESPQRIYKKRHCNFITERLNERWNLISHNIHPASFLLDPRFRDIQLDELDIADGIQYIKEISSWDTSIREQWARYRAKDGLYSSFVDEEEDPRLFWMELVSYEKTKSLALLALDILGFPQSNSSVERTFSSIKHIHTWKRNRISRKKLAMLTYVYVNDQCLNNRWLE